MKTSNILLIGTGQLGSRHLQGLAESATPIEISLVEPNAINLETALVRFQEMAPPPHVKIINTVDSLDILPEILYDVVIIATNADIRANITAQLLKKQKIRYIIFEKVAFQSEKQFEDVINLLKEKGIKSWVNCPRRFFPFYSALRDEIVGNDPVELVVRGVEWGLACNAVHQIDLLAFLSGELYFKPENSFLEDSISESRRKGFIEFYGTITGRSENGSNFSLYCKRKNNEEQKPWLEIIVKFGSEKIIVNESAGEANYYRSNNNVPYKTERMNVIYQSGLTHLQVKQILEEGNSFLPSLEESFEIHKPLLSTLREQYRNSTGKEIQNLPIT